MSLSHQHKTTSLKANILWHVICLSVNCQGFSGLGMGFASFVAGDIGQRIILKSGLLPIKFLEEKL